MDCLTQAAPRVQSQFSLRLHRISWEFHEFSMFREIPECSRFVATLLLRTSFDSCTFVFLYLCFNCSFAGQAGLLVFMQFCSGGEPPRISGTIFTGQMPFPSLNNSITALNKTQSIDPSQWPGLILSLSITGLREGHWSHYAFIP